MAAPINPSPTGFPVPLSPAKIEKELAKMWSTQRDDGSGGELTHFCLGTIVWLGSSRFIPRIRKIFGEIINKFPCRLILLECSSDESQQSIDSYINAYCYLDSGSRGKVCSEEIHLKFNEDQLHHIRSLVLPLLVTDVPTFFWYFSSMPERYHSIVGQFSKVSDVTINEIAFRANPADGLREMSTGESRAVSLSWFRCAPLRNQIASFFDDPEHLSLLNNINRIEFGWHGSEFRKQALTNACVTVGWLAEKLKWEYAGDCNFKSSSGQLIEIQLDEHEQDDSIDCAEITNTCLSTGDGDRFSLNLANCSGHMKRSIEYGNNTARQSQETTIKMHTLSESEGLVQLLQVPHSRTEFVKAARHAWQLMSDYQRKFNI